VSTKIWLKPVIHVGECLYDQHMGNGLEPHTF